MKAMSTLIDELVPKHIGSRNLLLPHYRMRPCPNVVLVLDHNHILADNALLST